MEHCQIGRNHRHFLSIFPNIPEEMGGDPDRKPEQIVKCWGILENLVVIASSIVRKGTFAPYILKTGYRTYPQLKKKSWLKQELFRADEVGDFFDGKKQVLIADHME